MRDACGICSTQPRLVRRCGPRHRLTLFISTRFLIAHRAGTGRAPEPPAHDRTPITAARHASPFHPPSGDGESASATARRFVRSLEEISRDLARPWPVTSSPRATRPPMSAAPLTCPPARRRPTGRSRWWRPRSPGDSLAVAANVLTSPGRRPGRRDRKRPRHARSHRRRQPHRRHQALEATRARSGLRRRRVVTARLRAGRRLARTRVCRSRSASVDRPRATGRTLRRGRDRRPRPRRPNSPEAITDTLAHLLTVCVIADAASAAARQVTRPPAASMHAATQARLGSSSESAKPIAHSRPPNSKHRERIVTERPGR